MLKCLGPYHASIVHEQLIAFYVWCSKRLRYEVHQHIPTINNDATVCKLRIHYYLHGIWNSARVTFYSWMPLVNKRAPVHVYITLVTRTSDTARAMLKWPIILSIFSFIDIEWQRIGWFRRFHLSLLITIRAQLKEWKTICRAVYDLHTEKYCP